MVPFFVYFSERFLLAINQVGYRAFFYNTNRRHYGGGAAKMAENAKQWSLLTICQLSLCYGIMVRAASVDSFDLLE